MYRFFEHFITLKEIRFFRLPLLISYAHHGEPEGFWMAHFSPDGSPGRVRRPVGKFNQIQGILKKFPEGSAVPAHHFIRLILTGKTHVQHGQRLGSNQFAEQKIFIIPHSKGLIVMAVDALIAVLRIRPVDGPAVPVVPSGPGGL